MSRRPAVTVAVVVVAACAALVSGCGPSAGQAGSLSTGTVQVSSTVSTAAVSTGTVTTTSAGTSSSKAAGSSSAKSSAKASADLTSLQTQLDAMQKELDRLSMPSDKDFNGASGAVY